MFKNIVWVLRQTGLFYFLYQLSFYFGEKAKRSGDRYAEGVFLVDAECCTFHFQLPTLSCPCPDSTRKYGYVLIKC
tara:strand:+ start:125 stop:352 length:228 start_codon:yes stop_codon:yes gene_type:complete